MMVKRTSFLFNKEGIMLNLNVPNNVVYRYLTT